MQGNLKIDWQIEDRLGLYDEIEDSKIMTDKLGKIQPELLWPPCTNIRDYP